MTSIHVQTPAAIDIVEAAERYEARRPGLGVEFILEVDAAIDRCAEYPQMYEVKEQGTKRILVQRFPYSIYFRLENDVVEVFAVLHQHRGPESWRSRIS